MSRTETTAMLSKLVEKRLKNRVSYIPRDIDQVLVPTAKGDKLRCLYDVSYGDKRNSYRRRPASEMLYAMIEANGKRTN